MPTERVSLWKVDAVNGPIARYVSNLWLLTELLDRYFEPCDDAREYNMNFFSLFLSLDLTENCYRTLPLPFVAFFKLSSNTSYPSTSVHQVAMAH
jgi:hypothetical protein